MNIPKSLDMQRRAQKLIPGMTQLLSKRPDMFAPGVWPGYYAKAKGVEVWDLDGNRYIDMSISGIGANVLGYADPDVDGAVKAAIEAGTSSSLNCPEEVELAELLCEIHPWADMVRFARSGGESMTIAVRIARAFTGKDVVAFCGYHGWHDWYLAANLGTENALGEHLLPGLSPKGVPKGLSGTALPFRYNKVEELRAIVESHSGRIAAVVLEPIRNDPPQPGFLESVRAFADKAGAVLIIDEISSGFRLNTGGAHLLYNIVPDIAVLSKAMGNGYPIAAVIGRREIMEAAQNTFISSTMWTERVGPAAALATIKKHRAFDVGKHLTSVGTRIQEGWTILAAKNALRISVSGIPPLSHFNFEYDNAPAVKAYFVQLMLDRGFLVSTLFYSMFAHSDQHVTAYLDAADQAFAEISEALRAGAVETRLRGKPASVGFKRLI
jgi:glutamate-1-semialdehyde 2,1-aminomutase